MELSAWLSTIAALGALIAAVYAALTSARLLRIERERDLASGEERRRAGAAKVIAWSAVHFDSDGGRAPSGLILRNGDSTPIFDIEVESVKRGSKSPILRMALLPPGEYFVAEKPIDHWDFAQAIGLVVGSLSPKTKNAGTRVTDLRFTDASGNRWRRDERGRLTAVEG